MKNAAEVYAMVEERFSGWSFETRTLLYALSRIPDLPKDIEGQARQLSQMVVKCEVLGYYRIALHQLTLREHRFSVTPAGEKAPQNITLTPAAGSADAASVTALIAEIKRLEGELSGMNVDFLAVLRFIRQNREKIL